MIGDLLFVCVRCGSFHALRETREGAVCGECGARFSREGHQIRVVEQVRPAWEWFHQVEDRLASAPAGGKLPWLEEDERLLAASEEGRLWRTSQTRPFTGFLNERTLVEELVPDGSCRIYLTDRRFAVQKGDDLEAFPLAELRCVTTDARHFVFRRAGETACYLEFPSQSPLFWELICRKAIVDYWARRGREVVETQPWVRFRDRERPVKRSNLLAAGGATLARPQDSRAYEALHSLIRAAVRPLLRWGFGLEVRGVESLPKDGAFLLVLNHEGYLDSFFALAALPVKIGFLAKNTEFEGAFRGFVMRLFRSIPVHRHRPDPVAVAHAVRRLRNGAPVAIFPEGERTWDGRRLPPKRTVVKLLMRAGVPIVPCRIDGSFAVLPRWDRRLQRRKVTLWVGRPFLIPESIGSVDEALEFVGKRIDELGRNAWREG